MLGLQAGAVSAQMSKGEAMYGIKGICSGPCLMLGRSQELISC